MTLPLTHEVDRGLGAPGEVNVLVYLTGPAGEYRVVIHSVSLSSAGTADSAACTSNGDLDRPRYVVGALSSVPQTGSGIWEGKFALGPDGGLLVLSGDPNAGFVCPMSLSPGSHCGEVMHAEATFTATFEWVGDLPSVDGGAGDMAPPTDGGSGDMAKVCESGGALPSEHVRNDGVLLNTLFDGSLCMFDACGNPITPQNAVLPPQGDLGMPPGQFPPSTFAPIGLPSDLAIRISTWFPTDIGASCPSTGDAPGALVRYDTVAPAIPASHVRPFLALAGAQLSQPGNTLMNVCGPAGNQPCPADRAPKLHVFDSTCTPTNGMATFRILNLSVRDTISFEIRDPSNTLIATDNLIYGTAGPYRQIPVDGVDRVAYVRVTAKNSLGNTIGTWNLIGSGSRTGSFAYRLHETTCGSLVFTGYSAFFDYLVEKPTLCQLWTGLGSPVICIN